MAYHRSSILVDGGLMTIGEWSAPTDSPVTVVGVHGITSQHLLWSYAAANAPEYRFVAPDLRGRAGSRDLPGPWGIARHADDLIELCEELEIRDAIGAGHSMGAFVLLIAAAKRPDLFRGLLFIDGGLPLAVPLNMDEPEHLARVARETVEGFETMRFASIEDHRAFWRAHPSITIPWDETIEAYADNELIEDDGFYRWTCRSGALEQDTRELYGTVRFRNALDTVSVPITLLTAAEGLLPETPSTYSERQLNTARLQYPDIRFVESDTNHYMTVLGDAAGERIADELRLLERRAAGEGAAAAG